MSTPNLQLPIPRASRSAGSGERRGDVLRRDEFRPARPRRSSWELGVGNWRLTRSRQKGFTFIELLVVTTILMILASAVMPLAKVTVQRQKEVELRRALREMRTAIDKYKDAADAGVIGMFDVKAGSEGYPATLDILVEGVSVVNDQSGRKLKFLRKVPIDPMTKSTEWGLRSYQDRPDATTWGGQNVFDVYTKSTATALDGTQYRDW